MKIAAKNTLCTLLMVTAAGLSSAALALTTPTTAGETDIANAPMASTGSTTVKPNVMFILDNSGSMNWEYLPDSVNNNDSKFCFRNHNYNGVYYNPGLTYDLPVNSTGTPFANASFTAAKDNGFDSGSATTNLAYNFSTGNDSGGQTAYYYEYTGASPAVPVRGTCYADTSYTKRVVSSLPITTISVSGSSSAIVSGITVNGVQIMSAATSSSSTNSTVASRIAAAINNCTTAISGNCGTTGYAASASGSTVTIVGPSVAATYTPVTTKSGVTLTTSAFSSPSAADIAQAQNFANWYSYYRSRLLTMKSAAGRAFKDIGNNFRVGFSTISYTGVDSTNAGFLKIMDFDTAHKADWYTKLYNASGTSYTPLRGALSKAGRIYAGALLTGADDPVQYSCQQNFTILSTDGYWNTNTESSSAPKYGPYQINNTTSVGQQDGAGTPRPMNDGESSLKSTSQRTETKTQVSRATNQLQKRTEQIQSRTSNLQRQISQLQQDVGTLQSRTSPLQTRTGTLQGTLSKVLMRCNNTAAACGAAPTTGIPNANWSLVTSGSCTVATNVQCSAISGLSGNVNVASTCNTSATLSSTAATSGRITITVTGVNSTTRLSSLKIGGVEILTGTTGGTNSQTNSNNEVATRTKEKVGNGYTATVASNVVTVTHANITAASTITYTISTGSATLTGAATSGTPASYTLNNADSNGNVYSACSYSWGGWTNAVAACTANKSVASPYTVTLATECQYAAWSAWSNAGACTPAAQDATSPHTVVTASECQYVWANAQGTPSCSSPAYVAGNYANASVYRNCQTVVTSPYANAASCTTSAVPDGSGNTTQCQYTAWSAWANAASCSALAQSAASPYTEGTATECQTTDTGWVGVSSCTPGVVGGQTITCQTTNTGPTLVASCTDAAAALGNSWTQTVCTPTTVQAATGVATCTAVTPVVGNNYTTTSCNTVTTGPAAVSVCTAEAASASNNYTSTTCGAGAGGISDTLADVAMYYYKTDLRTSALGNCSGGQQLNVTTCLAGTTPDNCGVCENNVPGSGGDVNAKQHMTTFTLGLGVDGTLGYADDYLSGGSADYNAIKQGTKNWPDPISNTGAERIDDLWHAAVNGRGVYYSARDPDTLVSGISNALAGVTARAGSAAAAATSNLEPVAGDNYLFVALYRTVYWDGDLQAKTIDPVTGAVSSTPIWTAQPLLDLKVGASSDTRTIYAFDSTNANGNYLMDFTWANVGGTGYFSNICAPTAMLSHCSTLSAADQAAASGANLVNFLRGQNGNEGTLYRDRDHVLGDMVTSQPVYVKKPPFEYTDSGYATFRDTTQASRTPMVYVASNDGMLHAFNGDTGQESWAYIPPMVMSNLYRLADKTYSVNHRYYVDGSPSVADICPNAPSSTCTGAQWKTILVGGLNAGGRGYYALDITDPAAPKALWNFTTAEDANLGYSFGNPIVTKRKDGTWVVVVTSGYNNLSPGDGKGYLYVLNANSGALLEKIGTTIGSAASPSGLGKINVWVDSNTDNTAQRFYGGDLFGNLWRFTLDSATPPAGPVSTDGTAVLLAEVGTINGAGVQPITTKPELTLVPYGGTDHVVVQFGTGRYLGNTDLANTDQQSVYAIKDTLSGTGLGLVRTNGILVQQTLSHFTDADGTQKRSTSSNTVDWVNKSGWYVDLNPSNSSPGERVNVDIQLQLGSLTVASNVPSDNACNVGGYSFLYNFDFKSGQYLATAVGNAVGVRLSTNAMVAGMNTIRLQSGKIITIITDTGGGITSQETPTAVASSGVARRVSWRELIQ